MRRKNTFSCPECGNELCGEDLVFNLNDYGNGIVCEECFTAFLEDEYPDLLDLSVREAADELGIYYTTADSYLDNEYGLYLDSVYELYKEDFNF